MKLAISNIAWPNSVRAGTDEENPLLTLLRRHGVTGIEVAPTKIWPSWDDCSTVEAKAYARKLKDVGFSIPALQSLLFNRPDLKLFGSPGEFDHLLAHIKTIASLAEAFGATTLVFGAPKNRKMPDVGDSSQIKELGAARLNKIGDICGDYGVYFCLEPNPKEYSCNFVTNVAEGLEIVKQTRHERVRLHLDSGCMTLAGDSPESIPAAMINLSHFHVSEPYLKPFSQPICRHKAFASALKGAGYDRWLSIEMLSDRLDDIAQAVTFVSEQYNTD